MYVGATELSSPMLGTRNHTSILPVNISGGLQLPLEAPYTVIISQDRISSLHL